MRKIKCIAAILIGLLLGLVSACTTKQKTPRASEQPSDEQTIDEKNSAELPEKEKELPVRRPMLE